MSGSAQSEVLARLDVLVGDWVDPDTAGYTQHYYDARGVARLYAMSLTDGVWRLLRNRAGHSAAAAGGR